MGQGKYIDNQIGISKGYFMFPSIFNHWIKSLGYVTKYSIKKVILIYGSDTALVTLIPPDKGLKMFFYLFEEDT